MGKHPVSEKPKCHGSANMDGHYVDDHRFVYYVPTLTFGDLFGKQCLWKSKVLFGLF